MQSLKQRIAEVYKKRKKLKPQLESGELKPANGFTQLGIIDG
jgi:hypothetical protein